MFPKRISMASGLLVCAALPMSAGCSKMCSGRLGLCTQKTSYSTDFGTTERVTRTAAVSRVTDDLPPNAQVGQCYAKVYTPPKFDTASERVCIREASERIEVIPAQFDWVEERVCVKPASTHLECTPAEFEWREHTITTGSSHNDWVLEDSANCKTLDGQPVRNVFCLVNFPATQQTVRAQYQSKPANCREVSVPAEFETVRVQKLVKAATTRKITIPAEYETVNKTVKVADGKMEWQRVVCDITIKTDAMNGVKRALLAAGYDPGPLNDQFDEPTRIAMIGFQKANGLATGELTYETMNKLGVPVE